VKIDHKLNLVVPVERAPDDTIYLHSTPISEITFTRYYLVLSKLWAMLLQTGVREIAGPRVAHLMLKEVAQATPRDAGLSWWEGVDGVENGLLLEIERLTNVIMPGGNGWITSPLREAEKRGALDSETISEAMGQIVFFIAVSAAAPRGVRHSFVTRAAELFDSQITSLNSTAFANFLRTSTKAETSEPKEESTIQPPKTPEASASVVSSGGARLAVARRS
jgi:hypothetical protein